MTQTYWIEAGRSMLLPDGYRITVKREPHPGGGGVGWKEFKTEREFRDELIRLGENERSARDIASAVDRWESVQPIPRVLEDDVVASYNLPPA
jgi:hypothetical protein